MREAVVNRFPHCLVNADVDAAQIGKSSRGAAKGAIPGVRLGHVADC